MKPNQNLLIAQVVKFLNGQNCLVWRQENNGRIDEKALVDKLLKLFDALSQVNYTSEQKAKLFQDAIRKAYRGVPCSLKGVSDVIGFNLQTGHWISVEIKLGEDKMRPEQEDFARIVRASGAAEFWLCREINSFKAGWLKKHPYPAQSAAA